MFKRILIANRGEVAVRIIRACRELDIETVAVYSEADRDSLHVRFADYAYLIGPPPSKQSYLAIDRILEAARSSKSEAIHPGYGFLAESPEFAARCQEEAITFIGPSPAAIETMGDKVKARQAMKKAGVPIIPGSDQPLKSEEEVLRSSKEIGYPVMLKAVAGGGGKALRLVQSPKGIKSAYRAVRSEASSFFGDDRLYVEKYIEKPRHVEIQIIADREGHVLHLYDRECSIQRRHQKVIEESPAPAIDHKVRKAMGKIAVEGAKAVDYLGVGTLEFLVDRKKNFYFLEMNTRLQVEHPVTERVVGIDLVKAQIEVAAGKKLPWKQRHISQNGVAIECRIYAEDPDNGFMPCPGKIQTLRSPAGLGVRVDGGVYGGSLVPIHYDPMIAKLVVWGENREEMILRMLRALKEYQISGIKTNIPFHLWVLRHPRFRAGDYDTHFVDEEYGNAKKAEAFPHKEVALVTASIEALKRDQSRALSVLKGEGSERSPWKERGREEMLRA